MVGKTSGRGPANKICKLKDGCMIYYIGEEPFDFPAIRTIYGIIAQPAFDNYFLFIKGDPDEIEDCWNFAEVEKREQKLEKIKEEKYYD